MPFYVQSSRVCAREMKKEKGKGNGMKKPRLASLISDPRGELAGTTDDRAGKLGVGALLIDRNV